jgi:putative addiction module component (TIGR02574 family)
MNRDTSEILKEVMALPTETRAALADSLLESLDTEVDEGAEEAWREEIQRRLAEIDTKTVSLVSWTEARSRLMATRSDER